MNLEDLRAAQVDERGTDSLQPLPASFYEQAADYLADLRGRRDKLADRASDPFGSEAVRQLTDELETAEEVVEALYERRVGKLIKRASLAAAGLPADDDGLTDEERELFSDLVERIQTNRETVLTVLTDDTDGSQVTSAGGDDVPGEPEAPLSPAAEATGPQATESAATEQPAGAGRRGGVGPAESPPEALSPDPSSSSDAVDTGAPDDFGDPDRMTVRITADVGEIYGVDDRVYTLGNEDVVTLPAANAKPLLERGAAEQVN